MSPIVARLPNKFGNSLRRRRFACEGPLCGRRSEDWESGQPASAAAPMPLPDRSRPAVPDDVTVRRQPHPGLKELSVRDRTLRTGVVLRIETITIDSYDKSCKRFAESRRGYDSRWNRRQQQIHEDRRM